MSEVKPDGSQHPGDSGPGAHAHDHDDNRHRDRSAHSLPRPVQSIDYLIVVQLDQDAILMILLIVLALIVWVILFLEVKRE